MTRRQEPARAWSTLHSLEDTRSQATRPVIIVSTYRLLAEGLDNLQGSMNIVIRLGEPWTQAHTEQTIQRLHRRGQDLGEKGSGIWYSWRGCSTKKHKTLETSNRQ